MPQFSILTFGEPRAVLPDDRPLRFPTEKTLELLLLAALAPKRSVTRSGAAAALRADHDEPRARRALSTDLWRLRKVFDDAGLPSTEILATSGRAIALDDGAEIFVDARFLEEVWDEVGTLDPARLNAEQAARMRLAIDYYIDDFAAALDQEWCFIYREKLRSKHLGLINQLLAYEVAQDNWAAGITWAERLLTLDPLLEQAHRTLMQCHFLMGNRASAIRQYGICRETLDRELGVAPSEETTRMYRGLVSVPVEDPATLSAAKLRASAPLKPPPRRDTSAAATDRPLTDQLSMALGSLDAARSLVANVDHRLRQTDRSPQG
jgi:DNA-binding SARP family transcriptional activator